MNEPTTGTTSPRSAGLARAATPTETVQSFARRRAARSGKLGADGFTLIEIMVVVFILGLLITLVAPRILGRTDEARQTKAAADIKAIEQALSLYKLDNGFFPTTEQGLEALVTRPTTGLVPRRWNPEGYLEKVPVDPWGSPYVFRSDGSSYVVLSFGADGAEGGEGVNADIDSRNL
jgi:general secretion pathway protein G